MSQKMNEVLGNVLILLLLPFAVIVNGLLLKLFWEWFVCPLGVTAIGAAQALGISLIVSMLTHQGSLKSRNKDDDVSPWAIIAWWIVKPLFLLAMGAIFHSCMTG